jgi:hypothetical protein
MSVGFSRTRSALPARPWTNSENVLKSPCEDVVDNALKSPYEDVVVKKQADGIIEIVVP